MPVAPLQPEDTPIGLAVRMAQLEKTTASGIKTLNDKLDSMTNNFASQTEHTELQRRVSELENGQKWFMRTVIGAIIIAIVSLAFSVSLHLKVNGG